MNKDKIHTRWNRLWTIILMPLVLISCNKDLMLYEGQEGVYFAVQHGSWNGSENTWPFYNYSTVPFAKMSKADTTVLLKVMVTGRLYTYDRLFFVEINPDSTTAELNTHYKPITREHILPANKSSVHIPITLMRAADLKTAHKKIGLRLAASEELGLSFPDWDAIPGFTSASDPIVEKYDAGLHTIIVNDWIIKPAVWSGAVAANMLETGDWGEFTEEKITLMYQVMNLEYTQFENRENMPTALINLVTREMASYLQDKFNAGEPVLEKDGRLMYVKGVTWTSYVGIPWKK